MSWTRRQLFTSFLGSPRASNAESKGAQVKALGRAQPMTDEAWDALLSNQASRYSRNQEELIIRHFFRDRRGGVFLDVGCFQPEKNSATCYLERHLGWTGQVVDALDLSETWRRFRPKSRFARALLTEQADVPETFFLADGSSTLLPERLDEEPFQWEKKPRAMVSTTLDHVLAEASLEAFDFLALHVNGVERRVLAGLDLDRYRPRLIKTLCVLGQRRPMIDFLRDAGYRLIKEYRDFDPINRYFTRDPEK